jgi:hypothetical protein
VQAARASRTTGNLSPLQCEKRYALGSEQAKAVIGRGGESIPISGRTGLVVGREWPVADLEANERLDMRPKRKRLAAMQAFE